MNFARFKEWKHLIGLLAFTVLGFLVMGYHPGIEDDGVYLSAIKSDLNPALFPHDSEFFRLQLQATVFDRWVAGFIRVTHIPVADAELLLQLATIALTLFACWNIARILFADERAQWGGVAMVAAMFTLPVAGTALFLADPHLHPRNVATALVLMAISWIIAGRRWLAVPLLLAAFVIHPIMAAFGISFCFFLTMALSEPVQVWLQSLAEARAPSVAASFAPLGWIFEPQSPAWRKALDTRTYYYLYRWHWYEWLGALAPLFLFWLLWRVAQKRGETLLARFALAVFAYGVFQQDVAMVMLGSPALVRLTPLALPPSGLRFPGSLRRLPDRKVPSEERRVALGAVSGRLQWQHVCRSARAVQRQRSDRMARTVAIQSMASGFCLDPRQHTRRRVLCP
jgi:hypothetical protein